MPKSHSEGPIRLPALVSRDWVERHYHFVSETPFLAKALDFSDVVSIDSAGLAFVWRMRQRCREQGRQLELLHVPQAIEEMLDSWGEEYHSQSSKSAAPDGIFARTGAWVERSWEEMVGGFSMLAELLYWSTLGLRKRCDIRHGALGEQMFQLGFKAIGIVSLLSFLVGVVLALQSALFLKTYGAGIFLSQMVGWTMLRELGPLLTAVILAGRTGSATTAQIATMGVGEEIDALRTMGIHPIQFIVTPKLWALMLTMPFLSIYASVIGIVGAYLVSLLYLDISSTLFIGELCKNIFLRDIRAACIKSVVFAVLIIWVGAYFGFRVRGGAEEVGRETTASVVACIFAIILADAFFSFIL